MVESPQIVEAEIDGRVWRIIVSEAVHKEMYARELEAAPAAPTSLATSMGSDIIAGLVAEATADQDIVRAAVRKVRKEGLTGGEVTVQASDLVDPRDETAEGDRARPSDEG